MPASPTPEAIGALLARVKQSAAVDRRCATQVAIARQGEILAFETFGRAPFQGEGDPIEERDATHDTLFVTYSVTKAVVSAPSWILLQEGTLSLADRVADHIPEFGSHGKDVVTVEELLTHTAGSPGADLPRRNWPDPAKRVQHF